MKDLATEPFITIGKGEKTLYKFKNGNTLYTKKEFSELIKNSLMEGTDNEVKQETEPVNKKDSRRKSSKN